MRVRHMVPRSLRTIALLGVVAAGALLPLYGDPRTSPVSHPEWARMVLRSMDLLETGQAEQASQVFATLSGRDSRAYRADRYLRGEGIEPFGEGTTRGVKALAAVAEVVYPVAIARGGDYRLRLRMAGSTEAEAELAPVGASAPQKVFRVQPGPHPGWVEAGATHLDPGAYTASVLLPAGSVLEWLELAPPCTNPIEPRGGWRAPAVTSTEDVAVTVLQASDEESELPPAAPPLEWRGSDFQIEEGQSVTTVGAAEHGALKSGPRGARGVLVANLPEPGLYSLSVFGMFPGGQSWTLDACRKSVLCPSPDDTARWRQVLSGVFAAGPHSFTVNLGPDSAILRARLERKKDTIEDYTATVRRLGLELGPGGPVTREKADEARRFITRRRTLVPLQVCGDIVRPATLTAALSGAGEAGAQTPTTPTAPGGGTQPGPQIDPLQPPVIPPQDVASPLLPVGVR